MITQEELLSYMYDSMGVDPALADLSVDYTDQYLMAMPQQRGPSSMPPHMQPPMMTSSSPMGMLGMTEITQMTRSIDHLTRSVDRVLGAMQQTTQRTQMSIQDLATLQAQTQQRISSQQIGMQAAQWYNPSAFEMAPGLEYQTNPQDAIFRNRVNASHAQIADRPSSSFFQDVAVLSPYLYEPSFAEDSFMAQYAARMRMEERGMTLKRGASEIATQLLPGAASWALVKGGTTRLAAGALAKIGMGSLAGPIGTAAAIADVGLGLFGLPSVSGTISKGVESAFDATIGRAFVNVDMARDIQKMTGFYTGAGADPSGQGLSLGRAGRVVSGLHSMAGKDVTLGSRDYMGIFAEAGQQGLLSQSINEDQMLQNVRSISKNLRLFMRISGDPDYKNAIKQMGDLHRMGVGINDLGGAAQNIQNFSRMAGISTQQAQVFGQQGAMIFQQAGANMGTGYQTGIMSRAFARQAVQSGQFRPGVLASMGGEEGVAQSLTESIGAMFGGPMGQFANMGFLKKDGRGNLSVDSDAISRFERNELSFDDIRRRAESIGRDPRAVENFFNNKTAFQDAITGRLGAIGGAQLVMSGISGIMERTGRGYQSAAQMLLGPDQTFTHVFNKETIPAFVEAEQRQNHIQRFNELRTIKSQNSVLNRVWGGIKESIYENLGRPMGAITERKTRRIEESRAIKMGLSPGMSPRNRMGASDYEAFSSFNMEVDRTGFNEVIMGELEEGASSPFTFDKDAVSAALEGVDIQSDVARYYRRAGMFSPVTGDDVTSIRERFMRNQIRVNPKFAALSANDRSAAQNEYMSRLSEVGSKSSISEVSKFYDALSAEDSAIRTKDFERFMFRVNKMTGKDRYLVSRVDGTSTHEFISDSDVQEVSNAMRAASEISKKTGLPPDLVLTAIRYESSRGGSATEMQARLEEVEQEMHKLPSDTIAKLYQTSGVTNASEFVPELSASIQGQLFGLPGFTDKTLGTLRRTAGATTQGIKDVFEQTVSLSLKEKMARANLSGPDQKIALRLIEEYRTYKDPATLIEADKLMDEAGDKHAKMSGEKEADSKRLLDLMDKANVSSSVIAARTFGMSPEERSVALLSNINDNILLLTRTKEVSDGIRATSMEDNGTQESSIFGTVGKWFSKPPTLNNRTL